MRYAGAFLASVALLAQPPQDPLISLNQTFRAWYAAEKARRLEHAGFVVMVKGDALVFLGGAERREVPLLPDGYQRLKAVSHIPLALNVKLRPWVGEPMSPADLQALAGYQATLRQAMGELGMTKVPALSQARARRITAASWLLLQSIMEKGSVTDRTLRAYLRLMAPLVLAEAQEAAAMELTALDSAMQAWRKDLGPGEWRGFHVVVMGAHMAREQEIAMQYFLKLTGEKREGGRVIFLEGQWDEAKAMDLLATHLVDGDVGRDFFGDPMRMHRDLLSDAARAWLRAHPARR